MADHENRTETLWEDQEQQEREQQEESRCAQEERQVLQEAEQEQDCVTTTHASKKQSLQTSWKHAPMGEAKNLNMPLDFFSNSKHLF